MKPREMGRGALRAAFWLAISISVPALAAPAVCVPPSKAAATGALARQLPLIAPRVIHWAQAQEAQAMKAGAPLGERWEHVARTVGVKHPGRIRIVVVDEIPLPDEPLLKAASVQVGLSQSSAAGLTLGHAVIVRRGYEADARLLSHELRHVAQYEACGGVAPFLSAHLTHLVKHGYDESPFEVDARAHEARHP